MNGVRKGRRKWIFAIPVLLFGILVFSIFWLDNWGWTSSGYARNVLEECVQTMEKYHPLCKKQLPEKTKDIYTEVVKKYENRWFVSRYELFLDLERTTRSLGDGHTGVLPYGNLNRYFERTKNKKAEELSFEYQEGKIYVSVEGQKYQLMKLNGYSQEEILRHCIFYGEYENEYGVKKDISILNRLEGLVLYDLGKITDTYIHIQYLSGSGKLISRTYPFYTSQKSKTPKWSYEIEENYAILTINECWNTPEFSEFLDEFFTKLSQTDIQNLAIDLRKNGGGNDICAAVISHLGVSEYVSSQGFLQKPEGQVEDVICKTLPCSDPFNGTVYVLTSKNTYSSATVLAVTLSINDLGEIIGEPSSNSPSSYGDCAIETFADGNFLIQVSQYYMYLPVQGDTMKVDIPCPPEQAVEVFQKTIGR